MTQDRKPRAPRRKAPRVATPNNQADADALVSQVDTMKISPSSASTASLTDVEPKQRSTTAAKRKQSKRKPAPATTDDAPVVPRALNASEMSMWQSLLTGGSSDSASEATVPSPPQPDKTKKQAKAGAVVDKRAFLFSGLPAAVRDQLQLDDVAQYSVTDMKTAARISHFLMTLPGLTPNSIITDATACVGGNTASFCTFFRYVQAVEIDPTRFTMLVHNMHGVLTFVNIQCYCANYVDVCEQFVQDVVFVDPPWGGPEYRARSTVDLFLGDTELAEVCERLVGRTQYVVVKVPTNFDIDRFTFRVSGTVSYITHFRKMAMVVVDYRFVDAPVTDNNLSPEHV